MNTSSCNCSPINLTISDLNNPNLLVDSPSYTGYIPHKGDLIAIQSIGYRVEDRYIEYTHGKLTAVVLYVTRVFHV